MQKEREGVNEMEKPKTPMGEIEKALQEVANAVKSNEAVESIKVTLTFKKPKSSKATKESK